MNNNIEIKRSESEAFRKTLYNVIVNTLSDIRGDLPDDIVTMINSIDMNRTFIDQNFDIGDLFQNNNINKFLSMIYTDLFVQYNDVFKLEEYLNLLRSLFDNVILNNLYIALEQKSRSSVYKKLLDKDNTYTSIYHNTFIDNGIDISSDRLRTNIKSGILTINDNFENIINNYNTDVKVDLISSGGKLVYENNLDYIFDDNYLKPFFQNYLFNGTPNNSEIFQYKDRDDVLVCVTVAFSSTMHFNRLMLTSIGFENSEIVGLYYSDHINASWLEGSYYQINFDTYAKDFSIEMNFEDVYAKEFYIIIAQKGYTINNTDEKYNEIYRKEHLEEYLKNIDSHYLDKEYINTENSLKLVEQDIVHYKDLLDIPDQDIPVGSRSYIIAIMDLKIGLAYYNNYGQYQDKTEYSDGFIRNCKFLSNGIKDISNEGIYDSITLYSIQLNGIELYFNDTISGDVTDGNVVEENRILENGVYIIKDITEPLTITGHFLIDKAKLTDIQIHYNGEIIEPFTHTSYIKTPSYYFKFTDNEFSFIITKALAEEFGIFNSSIIILKYPVMENDIYGNDYKTNDIDILNRLGLPTRINKYLCNISSNYMYTKEPIKTGLGGEVLNLALDVPYNAGDIILYNDQIYRVNRDLVYTENLIDNFQADLANRIWTNTGGYRYKSYTANEYLCGNMDEGKVYDIGKGKNEPLDKDILIPISNDDDYAILAKNCVEPVSNFWYGMIDEPGLTDEVVVDLDGQDVYKFETYLDYIKDTVLVFVNGVIVNHIEYEDDTLLSYESFKNILYVDVNNFVDISSADIKISYVPLNCVTTTEYSDTTITSFNNTETYTLNDENKLKLNRIPFIDNTIINADEFNNYGNVYSWNHRYSVNYIPIEIFINNHKALDITDYKTYTNPTFKSTQKENEYEYYIDKEGNIFFNKSITGDILVKYYISGDRFIPSIYMFRSNSLEYYRTPELFDYTLLMNLQK